MYVCSNRDMCMLVQVSTEAREGHQTLWFWSYRWLETTIMDAGNRTGILWESNMCSWLLTISPAPIKHLKYFLPVCVCVACVYGCMCVYMCAEVRSQHQVFCPISLLLSVQWSFQSLHGLNQPADEEMGHFCIPFYLLCTSHPRGISIVCLAGTMPSSALPVCSVWMALVPLLFWVQLFLFNHVLVMFIQVAMCSCSFNIAMLGHSSSCEHITQYLVMWLLLNVWVVSSSRPFWCLLWCEHSVHLWWEWESWVIKSVYVQIDIVHQCPWVSGEIWMTNSVCMKDTKSNSYLL